MTKFDMTVIKASLGIVLFGGLVMVVFFATRHFHRMAPVHVPTDRLQGWDWHQASNRTSSGGVMVDQGALRAECLVSNGRPGSLALIWRGIVAETGHRYRISFNAKANAPREIRVSADQGRYGGSSANIGLMTTIKLAGDWSSYRLEFSAKGNLGHKIAMPVFSVGASTGVVWIKDITVEEVT